MASLGHNLKISLWKYADLLLAGIIPYTIKVVKFVS